MTQFTFKEFDPFSAPMQDMEPQGMDKRYGTARDCLNSL